MFGYFMVMIKHWRSFEVFGNIASITLFEKSKPGKKQLVPQDIYCQSKSWYYPYLEGVFEKEQ